MVDVKFKPTGIHVGCAHLHVSHASCVGPREHTADGDSCHRFADCCGLLLLHKEARTPTGLATACGRNYWPSPDENGQLLLSLLYLGRFRVNVRFRRGTGACEHVRVHHWLGFCVLPLLVCGGFKKCAALDGKCLVCELLHGPEACRPSISSIRCSGALRGMCCRIVISS